MANRVTFGTSGGPDQTTTRSADQSKALADVEVEGEDTSGDGGGFLLNLFSHDADRELTQRQVLRAYHESPPLHMAVSAIARAVGSIEYQWAGQASSDFSLSRPNRWHQSAEFFGLVAAYLKLTGEFYAIKAQASRGVELIPIPPHLIEDPEVRSGTWRVEDGAISLDRTDFDRDELVILHEPSLLDPFMHGRGSGQALGSDIDIDQGASEHTAAYLENHARPDMLVSLGDATKSDITRFRETMRQKHSGPAKTGKIEAFQSDISVETLMSSFDDLGLAKLREASSRIVRHVFGIPPSIIGDVSDTNRATAETEEYLFRKNLIAPLVRKIVEGLQEQLVEPDLEDELELTTGRIIPEDRQLKFRAMQRLPQAFTVGEARELVAEDPEGIDDPDQRLADAMPGTPAPASLQAQSEASSQKKRSTHPRTPDSRRTTSGYGPFSTRSPQTTTGS